MGQSANPVIEQPEYLVQLVVRLAHDANDDSTGSKSLCERFVGYIEVPLIDEHGTHSVQAIQSSRMVRDDEPCVTKEWKMGNCFYPLSQRDDWTLSVANLMGSKDQVKRVGSFYTGLYGKSPDGMYYSCNRSHCNELALTPYLSGSLLQIANSRWITD